MAGREGTQGVVVIDQGVSRVRAGALGRELAESEHGGDNAGGVGRQFASKAVAVYLDLQALGQVGGQVETILRQGVVMPMVALGCSSEFSGS